MTHPYVHAGRTPDKPAFIMAETGETVTYRQLDERSNQGAQLFRKLGLQVGESIAIFMDNHPRFFEICWAAQRAGLYFTAISSKLSAPEVDYIATDCGARVFITSPALSKVAAELNSMLPNIERRYMVEAPVAGYESWEAARDAMPAERIADETQGRDMLYSSGTTGRPKGVKAALTGKPLEADPPMGPLRKKLYGLGEDVVYLSPAPFYHSAPLRYNLAIMTYGGTCVLMQHFEAERALQLIERHKVTHSQWVPTHFVRMLKLDKSVRSKYDLSSHKVAIHAAAPCPVPVKKEMIDWWGPILYEYYAGTEGNGLCSIDSHEWLKHPGSVGKAVMGELHIVSEDGTELGIGEAGTIYFSGGPAFAYHNDPDKTKGSYNDKGWSTIGDIGRVDEEGYLYLTDRKAFMIISGGVNIYPQEAENTIITHPKVADCAVIGVPNAEFGEEVKAVVQPLDWNDAGPDLAADIIAYCRERISHVKCPRTVDFERELPRHATGKLYKRLIRDRYWGNHDSKIV